MGLALHHHQLYGVIFTLSVVLTFAMANIFLLGLRITGSPQAAGLAALAAGLSDPLLFYGSRVYPDVIDAALLIYAVRKLYDFFGDRREGRAPSWGACLGFGAAVCYLPWVHEKMLGFSILLFLVYFSIVPWKWKTVLPVLCLALISELLQMRYYWVLYGRWIPIYVHAEPFRFEYWRRGFPGLLLDRGRGLVDLAPWVLVGFLGLVSWLKREARFAWLPLGLVVGLWAVTAAFGGWFCGLSRYMANVVPLLGVGLAVAWPETRRESARAVVLGLCAVAIFQGVAGLLDIELVFSRANRCLRDLFPAVRDMNAATWWMLGSWVFVMGWFWVFLRHPMRRLSFLGLLIPAAIILWAGWSQRPTSPRSVHWGLRPRLQAVLEDPHAILSTRRLIREDPQASSFGRRILLERNTAFFWPGLATRVREIPVRMDAKALVGDGQLIVTNAEGETFARGVAATGTTVRLVAKPLLALFEGSYRAEFRVRRPAGDAAAPGAAVLAVTEGEAMRPLREVRISAESLGPDWSTVSVPYVRSTRPRSWGQMMPDGVRMMTGPFGFGSTKASTTLPCRALKSHVGSSHRTNMLRSEEGAVGVSVAARAFSAT